MANRSGDKGREAENAVVNYLVDNGFPYAERKRLSGPKDKGDLTGSPGLMWEVKYWGNTAPRMALWMKQADKQTVNLRADYGILVVKQPGVGAKNASNFLAVMRWDEYIKLWDQARRAGMRMVGDGVFPHSSARISKLGDRAKELRELYGLRWVLGMPVRGSTNGDSLAVTSLGRLVTVVRWAGYGEPPFELPSG